MTEWPRRIVVAGFGAAGLAVCKELRAARLAGTPELVLSEEAHPPYDRPQPPLAKGFLAGKTEPDQLQARLRRGSGRAGHGAAAGRGGDRAGHRAPGGDRQRSQAQEHPYDALVVATGVRPPHPGHRDRRRDPRAQDPGGRTAAAPRVRQRGRSLVVVGGGFLGLEVAASARTLGVEVTVVEPMTEPMRGSRLGSQNCRAPGRTAPRARGVQIIAGTGVTSVAPASAKPAHRR